MITIKLTINWKATVNDNIASDGAIQVQQVRIQEQINTKIYIKEEISGSGHI